jgi:hypothetical protein
MTRLPFPQPIPTAPGSVHLGELAIAASTAGFPLTLCYRAFPAPELSQVWKHYIRCVGPDEVHHVHTQRDLNKLPERLPDLRIVLVHVARLHIPTAWSIQLMEPADAERSPCPAMLSRFVPDDRDEEPGATLLLHGTTQEMAAIGRWLATPGNADHGRRLPPGPMSVVPKASANPLRPPASRGPDYSRTGTQKRPMAIRIA